MVCLPPISPPVRSADVLAHEYAHAVITTARLLNRSAAEPLEEESWLDEAIAHVFERFNGFSTTNLDYRVSAFLSRPERYRLVVKDYLADDLFRSHGCRGALSFYPIACRSSRDRLPSRVDQERSPRHRMHRIGDRKIVRALFRDWTTELALSGLANEKSPSPSSSFELYERFGDWPLAGPNFTRVKIGEQERSFSLVGTSARFLAIEADRAGAFEIVIDAAAEAELQVTAIRLPDDLPRLEFSIDVASNINSVPSFQARVAQTSGVAVRLERLSWEPLVPEHDPRAARFSRGELAGSALRDAFSGDAITNGNQLSSRAICLSGNEFDDGPLVFKLVGIDDRGRRIAAWAVANPPKPPDTSKKHSR